MACIYSHDGFIAADEHDIAACGESAYAHACRFADEWDEWVELIDEDGDRYVAPRDANGVRPVVPAAEWEV